MHFTDLCLTHISSGCASPGPPVPPSTRPVCQNGAQEDTCTSEGGWTCWSFSPWWMHFREGCGSSWVPPLSLAVLASRGTAVRCGRWALCLQPGPGAPGIPPLGAAAACGTACRASHDPVPPLNCIKCFLSPKGKCANCVFSSPKNRREGCIRITNDFS